MFSPVVAAARVSALLGYSCMSYPVRGRFQKALQRYTIEQTRLVIEFLAELCVKRVREEAMTRSLSDIAPVLTVRDLSNYLRVHPSTIYRLLKSGQLPAFKVGSDWRFNVEEIDHWRVEREKKPGI
jgi:excisionase family DNA binding protein